MEEIYSIISGALLFPNPTTNSAELKLTLRQNVKVTITVINSLGQKIMTTETAGQFGENKINLNLEELNSGIYFVGIKADNNSITRKLIIE